MVPMTELTRYRIDITSYHGPGYVDQAWAEPVADPTGKYYLASAVDADRAALQKEIEDAQASATRAWAAATDETVVGFHRDMALRFSEDRDVQKHRARKAEAEVAALTAQLAAREQKIQRLQVGEGLRCDVALQADRDNLESINESLRHELSALRGQAQQLRALLEEWRKSATCADRARDSGDNIEWDAGQAIRDCADELSALLALSEKP